MRLASILQGPLRNALMQKDLELDFTERPGGGCRDYDHIQVPVYLGDKFLDMDGSDAVEGTLVHGRCWEVSQVILQL